MTIEGETQREHDRLVKLASEHLREIATEVSPIRHVLWEFYQRLARRHLERFEPSRNGALAGVSELPGDIACVLEHPDWGRLIETLVTDVSNCAESLIELSTRSSRPPAKGDGWTFAARFLRLGDPSIHPPSESRSDGAEFAARLDGSDALARQLVRSIFWRHEGIELPSAPPLDRLSNHIRKVTADIDWEYEVSTLRESLLSTTEALRLTMTKSVSLRRNGKQAWHAAAAFLWVWYRKGHRVEGTNTSDFSFESFLARWEPKLIARRSGPPEHDTGKGPFDPAYAMDREFRVFRPGSGTTKSPKSRRFNRGHK